MVWNVWSCARIVFPLFVCAFGTVPGWIFVKGRRYILALDISSFVSIRGSFCFFELGICILHHNGGVFLGGHLPFLTSPSSDWIGSSFFCFGICHFHSVHFASFHYFGLLKWYIIHRYLIAGGIRIYPVQFCDWFACEKLAGPLRR